MKKFTVKLDDELKKLEGVVMPCTSGNPAAYSIAGDVAYFKDRRYYFLFHFNQDVQTPSSTTYPINFINKADQMQYGMEYQLITFYKGTECERPFLRSQYKAGSYMIGSFFLSSLTCDDVDLFEEKVDMAVPTIPETLLTPVTEFYSGDHTTPEDLAIAYQEGYYNAIVNNDEEAFYSLDYEYGESSEPSSQLAQEKFGLAYELWKVAYPDKWKVIVDYRKKLISEGNMLVNVDTDTPATL